MEVPTMNYEDYRTYCGLNKELLKKIAKSQDDIIYKCDLKINRQTLSGYINGTTIPPVDILIKLCTRIGCEINDLLLLKHYENSNATYASVKKVEYLNQNGTHGPVILKDNKNKKYLEFKIRNVLNPNENDYCHDNVFLLTFDSYLLGAQKGSYLLTDFEYSDMKIIKEKDEAYVLIKDGDKLFISLVRKCKDEMGISNIRADIYSYIDIDGKTKLATINQLLPRIHSKIVKTIKEF